MRFKLGAALCAAAALTLAAPATPAQAATERWVMNGVPNELPNHRYDTVVVNATRSFSVHLYAHCSDEASSAAGAGDFAWSANRKGHIFVNDKAHLHYRGKFRVVLPRGRWNLHVHSSCNWTMTLPGFLDDIWYKGWDEA
jgi:hypothetical protein